MTLLRLVFSAPLVVVGFHLHDKHRFAEGNHATQRHINRAQCKMDRALDDHVGVSLRGPARAGTLSSSLRATWLAVRQITLENRRTPWFARPRDVQPRPSRP